ncbi:hypothetical protein ABFV05_020781 [Capra hircus]
MGSHRVRHDGANFIFTNNWDPNPQREPVNLTGRGSGVIRWRMYTLSFFSVTCSIANCFVFLQVLWLRQGLPPLNSPDNFTFWAPPLWTRASCVFQSSWRAWQANSTDRSVPERLYVRAAEAKAEACSSSGTWMLPGMICLSSSWSSPSRPAVASPTWVVPLGLSWGWGHCQSRNRPCAPTARLPRQPPQTGTPPPSSPAPPIAE